MKYGCLGRGSDLIALDEAFRASSVVVLSGPAGVGKTELAREYGRRTAETGEQGSPGPVIFSSLDYMSADGTSTYTGPGYTGPGYTGPGLLRILHELGTTLGGMRFAHQPPDLQRRWLLDYFGRNPSLLIWDDLDSVLAFLEPRDSQDLLGFLGDLAALPIRVLVTCQDSEWTAKLGFAHARHLLGGLEQDGARALADAILDAKGEVIDGPLEELVDLLRGNPLALRTVLPHTSQQAPGDLGQDLQLLAQGENGSDMAHIALECSLSRLSQRTRNHLPFLGLFRQRVLLDVLTFITQGRVYVSAMGEEIGWGACRTMLREARDHGILDSISPSVYLIPTQVSRFLRRRLEPTLEPAQVRALENELVRVYADLGDYFIEGLSSEDPDSAVTGVLAEEPNLLHVLECALSSGQWDNAQLVLQPLAQVYKMQERIPELSHLRSQLLAHMGPAAVDAQEAGATDLWLYLHGTEIGDLVDRQQMQEAQALCNRVLEHLDSHPDDQYRPQQASVYHHLGAIAQAGGEYGQAQDWYDKSLAINQALGNHAEEADTYHQLGLLSHARKEYDSAQEWHSRALAVWQSLGDEEASAGESYHLALVSEAQGQLEAALEWYHSARTSYEGSGQQSQAAAVYHRLGLLSQAGMEFEDASGWYQRALLTYEELGDDTSGAANLFQLGTIALRSSQYPEAREWLLEALASYQRARDGSGVANTCHQLGVAAHGQGDRAEAEEWYQSALDTFAEIGDEVASASTWGQMGLLADHRGDYAAAVWYVAHTYEIAVAQGLPLLNQARTHLAGLRSRMGTESFLASWQEVSDTTILPELEGPSEDPGS